MLSSAVGQEVGFAPAPRRPAHLDLQCGWVDHNVGVPAGSNCGQPPVHGDCEDWRDIAVHPGLRMLQPVYPGPLGVGCFEGFLRFSDAHDRLREPSQVTRGIRRLLCRLGCRHAQCWELLFGGFRVGYSQQFGFHPRGEGFLPVWRN